jgi:hypothetical protein
MCVSPEARASIVRNSEQREVITAERVAARFRSFECVGDSASLRKDLGKIRIGSGASVTSDAYPGRVLRGQVSYIDPVIDQTTQTP